MRDSLLRRFLIATFFVFVGFLGLNQPAMGQAAPTCYDQCFNDNVNNPNLLCCGVQCADGVIEYCLTACACGNGQIDTACDVTEECDDGNTNDGDGCSEICTNEVPPRSCGNGVVEVDEECDDGNVADGDGCSANCTIEVPTRDNCGDGVLDDYCGDAEECDDGNTRNGDGCDSNCSREPPLPGADAPTLPKVQYRGVDTDDLFALRETINKDLNIMPGDAVVPAIRGYYAPGPLNLQATVMPKFTAALQALFRALFPNFPFNGPNTLTPTSNPIGCTYSKDFCFTVPPPPGGTTPTTTCAKGCRETLQTAWSVGNQCTASMGCCTLTTAPSAGEGTLRGCKWPRAALPDNPDTPEYDPVTADVLRGNGIY